MDEKPQRTPTQNKAMHLWFQMFADELNGAGYDMKKTLKPEVNIPWTKESVKEFIWKPIQKAMTLKKSTTEMNTVEPSEICETINRHFSEKFGISVEWPSIQTLINSKGGQ